MLKETWKNIPGYENLYQVSNLGNVKSVDRIVRQWNGYNYSEKIYKGTILKQYDNKGYKRVLLYKNGKVKNYFVHRLVAQVFIPNPQKLSQVNHKDENKINNNVENLEWCSSTYNINYGKRNAIVSSKMIKRKLKDSTKKKLSISQNSHKKPIVQYDLKGNLIKRWESAREIERELNIRHDLVAKCCKGFLHKTNNYIFEYCKEV